MLVFGDVDFGGSSFRIRIARKPAQKTGAENRRFQLLLHYTDIGFRFFHDGTEFFCGAQSFQMTAYGAFPYEVPCH